MALAPFFDKSALAAAAVLQGFDRAQFAALLDRHRVALAFDVVAVERAEGRTSLTLLANLLARLYPNMALVPLGDAATAYAESLAAVVTAINPNIDLQVTTGGQDAAHARTAMAAVTVALVVGDSPAARFGLHHAAAIFVGSAGWEARISAQAPVGVGTSSLPFGAAAAACLGAANAFRHVFAAQLPEAAVDSALSFSTLSLSTRAATGRAGIPELDAGAPAALTDLMLGDVVQVGAGAVGEGLLWALARTPGLIGTLHVVDDQAVDASNPQRYILTGGEEAGVGKVAVATELFGGPPASVAGPSVLRQVPAGEQNALTVVPHAMRWGTFLAQRPQPWRLARVLVALDSAKEALPAWIANAWTQPGDLGITRHVGLGPAACLGCLYIPLQPSSRHEDVIVAEALGLADQLQGVRKLLATNEPVKAEVLSLIAERLAVPAGELLPFVGRPLRTFYSEAVCGGLVMRLQARAAQAAATGEVASGAPMGAGGAGQPRDRAAMVPMVFQSALAGVLLAAALVADAAGLHAPGPGQKAILNLLRPLPPRLLVPVAPHPSGKCLCQDVDFQQAFSTQWPEASKLPGGGQRLEARSGPPMMADGDVHVLAPASA
jgi:hypothetical protein